MSVTKIAGRQAPSIAEVPVGFADFVSGVAAPAVDIPGGAVIDDVNFVVDEAWNSVTSDVIVVGDGTITNRFITSVSVAATGNKVSVAATTKGYKYTAAKTIDIIWTGVGTAPTAGAGRLIVQYHDLQRADFSQR